MNRSVLCLAAVALVSTAASPALAKEKKIAWKRAFAKGISSPNSWERYAAVQAVDPQSKAGVKAQMPRRTAQQ